MTIPTIESGPLIQVPGLGQIKHTVDPALSGMPDWLHSVVWAVLVIALLYVVLLWLVRRGLPWFATVIAVPVRTMVEFGGVVFLLPGYLLSSALRRKGREVPGVMFMYDEFVQHATKACHWTAAALLSLPAVFRKASRWAIVAALAVLVGLWDVTYCTGAGPGCTQPTSQWMHSVAASFGGSAPTPKKTCAKKGKHSSAHSSEQSSKHSSKCSSKRD
jgi:hypothetical protein